MNSPGASPAPHDATRVASAVNDWTLREMTTLNRDIIRGSRQPSDLIDVLNQRVLRDLPSPETLTFNETQQLLVHLGFYGASVGRHCQEQEPSLRDNPTVPLDRLVVGRDSTPFREYFAGLADHNGTGHPHRDTYASISRWNTPTAEVYWQGERIVQLAGAFADTLTRSYTGDPGEIAFFNLVKKSEALELAANRLLTPIWEDRVDAGSATALANVQKATVLLAVVHRLNLDFASLPPESGLRPDFFLDTMRQFAVHWTLDDVPPSGAQDPEYLVRDFLVGIGFDNYASHVRKVFPALLDTEREQLIRLMTGRAIPDTVLAGLGLTEDELLVMSTAKLADLVRRAPIVAALHQLLFVNFRIGSSHLMLTKKFLFKPAYERERAGLPDNLLVSRYAGTTGMIERLLERLTQARKNHVLRGLNRLSHADLSAVAGIQQLPVISSEEVYDYVRQ